MCFAALGRHKSTFQFQVSVWILSFPDGIAESVSASGIFCKLIQLMKVIRLFFSPLLIRLYAGALMFVMVFQGVNAFWESDWNRWRLYRMMFTGVEDQLEHAVANLYSLRAEKQLLMALRSESEPISKAATQAIWEIWFRKESSPYYDALLSAVETMESGDEDAALEQFNTIIKERPGYAEAWNRRAVIYMRLGEFQESVSDGEQAIALNPYHFGAWRAVGLSRLRLGQILAARQALDISLTIYPNDPELINLMDWLRTVIRRAPKPLLEGVDRDFI